MKQILLAVLCCAGFSGLAEELNPSAPQNNSTASSTNTLLLSNAVPTVRAAPRLFKKSTSSQSSPGSEAHPAPAR